ncbi:unnamed protein product [Chondrus crispus]|uniref:Uncharacterized protein n=1 Tax=Chondrus crispus TaxID=2769 RepID=R7QEU8_CHOCR|nr:unnamed protein product [Chondrus crispus]CDF36313.1 unnamed protein product [Chondrus crispus]|eukprot:XP_005716132.1 unnamed protein product [Chondrus crispus]
MSTPRSPTSACPTTSPSPPSRACSVGERRGRRRRTPSPRRSSTSTGRSSLPSSSTTRSLTARLRGCDVNVPLILAAPACSWLPTRIAFIAASAA